MFWSGIPIGLFSRAIFKAMEEKSISTGALGLSVRRDRWRASAPVPEPISRCVVFAVSDSSSGSLMRGVEAAHRPKVPNNCRARKPLRPVESNQASYSFRRADWLSI